MSGGRAVLAREGGLRAPEAPAADRREGMRVLRPSGDAVSGVPTVPPVSKRVEARGPVARCDVCEREYPSAATRDDGMCPRCEARENAAITASYAYLSYEGDIDTRWEFSRSAMRDRLGVTGDRDE